jgi:hypothetical protein
MTRALIDDLGTDIEAGTGLPGEWVKRADQLLSLPDNARRQALAFFCSNLAFLFSIDPEWTDRALISAIAGKCQGDAHAFWAGFFARPRAPQEALYVKIKPALFELARRASAKRTQRGELLAGILLIGWARRMVATGARLVTNEEMRAVLIQSDDEFRMEVVSEVHRLSNERTGPWPKEALVFLNEVWPKQIVAKTSGVSSRLAGLAFSHEEDFPDYVDAVLPLVVRIDQDHLGFPGLEGSSVIERFPWKTLELLAAVLPSDARKWPYKMDDVLKQIVAAEPSLSNNVRLRELTRIWDAR